METEASSEMYSLLSELGDEQPEMKFTKVSGLLTARTNMDPYVVVEKVRSIVESDPWRVRYVQRLIPIDKVVDTSIENIEQVVNELKTRIGESQTYRITVEKRHTDLSSSDVIDNVAEMIDRNVDLDQQDWVVLIEIIGDQTGISVLSPDSIFSSVKTKRES